MLYQDGVNPDRNSDSAQQPTSEKSTSPIRSFHLTIPSLETLETAFQALGVLPEFAHIIRSRGTMAAYDYLEEAASREEALALWDTIDEPGDTKGRLIARAFLEVIFTELEASPSMLQDIIRTLSHNADSISHRNLEALRILITTEPFNANLQMRILRLQRLWAEHSGEDEIKDQLSLLCRHMFTLSPIETRQAMISKLFDRLSRNGDALLHHVHLPHVLYILPQIESAQNTLDEEGRVAIEGWRRQRGAKELRPKPFQIFHRAAFSFIPLQAQLAARSPDEAIQIGIRVLNIPLRINLVTGGSMLMPGKYALHISLSSDDLQHSPTEDQVVAAMQYLASTMS